MADPKETPELPEEESLEGYSDRELLEIVVGERAAKRLLKAAGSLKDLARWDLQEIVSRGNVPEKAARRLHAAFLVGRRGLTPKARGAQANSPGAMYRIFLEKVGPHLYNEHFYVMTLDTDLRVIGIREISRGTIDAAIVNPRDVIRVAALDHARAIAVAHNHPSGKAEPSNDDIALTSRLKSAAETSGIRFLDHLVIGDGDYYSFADAGRL